MIETPQLETTEEHWARIWCELNAHLPVPKYKGNEYETMAWIEGRIGKQTCLLAWIVMQEKRKR